MRTLKSLLLTLTLIVTVSGFAVAQTTGQIDIPPGQIDIPPAPTPTPGAPSQSSTTADEESEEGDTLTEITIYIITYLLPLI